MTTISEALAYTRTLVGKRTDQDGYYGAQCVDLPMHLASHFFGFTTWGNAIDYKTNKQPDGTERLYDINLIQPMDVFVLNGSWGYGHIGVVVEVSGDKIVTVEQNLKGDLEKGSPAEYRTWTKSQMKARLECIIRWSFENDLVQTREQKIIREDDGWELIQETGKFTLNVEAINVRTAPSLTADIVAVYKAGESVYYDGYTIKDGYVWISWIGASSGLRRYMAIGEHNGTRRTSVWGTFE